MNTLKIDFDDVTESEALNYVMSVIHEGRISNSKHGPCFCFVITFADGTRVVANRTKTMDTFNVSRRPT